MTPRHALLALLPLLAGCATTTGRIENGIYHSAKGYRVTLPASGWKVDHGARADLSLQGAAGPVGMLVDATCAGREPSRSLDVLARHLTFGLTRREVIETGLAGFAASRRTGDDCGRMRNCFEDYRRAVDATDWALAQRKHTEFHLSILTAVQAPALEILLLPMQSIVLAAPLPPILDDKALWEVPLHEKILSAIERADAEAAREAVIEHFAFRHSPLYADALAQLSRYESGDNNTRAEGGLQPKLYDGR